MRIYKTSAKLEDGSTVHSYQASQTEASKQRTSFKRLGQKPETQTVDIPTSKGPLIEWLNANAV